MKKKPVSTRIKRHDNDSVNMGKILLTTDGNPTQQYVNTRFLRKTLPLCYVDWVACRWSAAAPTLCETRGANGWPGGDGVR